MPTFYKIRYIVEELYVAVISIISRLIICIDQLNEGLLVFININPFLLILTTNVYCVTEESVQFYFVD